MPLARLRRLFLDVHLWMGVGLGLALIALGFSGSALVVRPEIEGLRFRAAVTQGPGLAPSAFLKAADAALGQHFTSWVIAYPRWSGLPVKVIVQPAPGEARVVILDPPTARVLAIDDPRSGFFSAMERLHGSFFIPGLGRKVIGWLGWAMTISCLTGLWLWWPRGELLRGLRWRRTASTNANLHHLLGFWLFIPLTIVSLTGVYMSFPQSARTLTQLLAPVAPVKPGGGDVVLEPTMNVDQVLVAARALEPGLGVTTILPPTQLPNGPAKWRIGFGVPAYPSFIDVNDATGIAKPEEISEGGDRFRGLVVCVHLGAATGLVWRILIFLAGLAPSVLAITGTLIWLRRRARRRRIALKAAPN